MKIKKIILPALITGIVLGAAIAAFYLSTFNRANITATKTIFISKEAPLESLESQVYPLLKNQKSFSFVAKEESLAERIKPGRYTIKEGTTNKALVRMLALGWETPMNLVLSGNIIDRKKLASILGNKLAADSLEFATYLNAPTTWEKYNLKEETLLSIFLPNTYEVNWTITPEELVERMFKEYEKFWNSERVAKAKKLGLTPTEVSILASIVCEESNHAPEMPTIAGVYINRLKRGMKLDADPTVKFAVGDPTIRRILYKHLEVDSPYNTYKNKGLPPGLITIPSIIGIDAVLNYKQHNYLYFCASPKFDGTHRFATTHAKHLVNARAYQAALGRMR